MNEELPSAKEIRAMFTLRMATGDQERQQVIDKWLCQTRDQVFAQIPEETLSVLQSLRGLPPSLLERYATLLQWYVGDAAQEVARLSVQQGQTEAQPLRREQLEGGSQLYTPPSLSASEMVLDDFQGAYKGLVEIRTGRGKRSTVTTRSIAVHKVVYETALGDEGDQVRQPSFWMPRWNGMTVYFPGEPHEVEVGWLLGDYLPRPPYLPAGMKPTPEQIAGYLQDDRDDSYWRMEVMKQLLRTPAQKRWLEENDITISDALEGRAYDDLDVEANLFEPWNERLGVKIFGF